MRRSKIACLLMLTVALCTACGKETEAPEDSATKAPTESVENVLEENSPADEEEQVSVPVEIPAPTTNEELFDYVTDRWKNQKAGDLYEYAGKELQAIMSKEDFAGVFEGLSAVGGELLDVSEVQITSTLGTDVYTSVVEFENVTLDWQVSVKKVKLTGFTYNIHFKDSFEVKYENGIVEKYFVFQNGGYEMNAVYTYLGDGEKYPAVLMIAGSAPVIITKPLVCWHPFKIWHWDWHKEV